MENKDIILIIIIFINIYLLYKMNKNESFANDVTFFIQITSSGETTSSISATNPPANEVAILNEHINNEVEKIYSIINSKYNR